MVCPKRLTRLENKVLLSKKSLYGLVQEARQYSQHRTQTLKWQGMIQSKMDPGLFVKPDPISIGVHTDDNIILEDRQNH